MAVGDEESLLGLGRGANATPEGIQIVDEFGKPLTIASPSIRLAMAAVVESMDREAIRDQRVDELSVAAAVVGVTVHDSQMRLRTIGEVGFPKEPQIVLGVEKTLVVPSHERSTTLAARGLRGQHLQLALEGLLLSFVFLKLRHGDQRLQRAAVRLA